MGYNSRRSMYVETKVDDGLTVLKFDTEDELQSFLRGMAWPKEDWAVMTTDSKKGDHTVKVYKEFSCSIP